MQPVWVCLVSPYYTSSEYLVTRECLASVDALTVSNLTRISPAPATLVVLQQEFHSRTVFTNISTGNMFSPLCLSVGTWLGRRIFPAFSYDKPSDLPSDSFAEQLTCRVASQEWLSQQVDQSFVACRVLFRQLAQSFATSKLVSQKWLFQ
jgi:hypothetical protein